MKPKINIADALKARRMAVVNDFKRKAYAGRNVAFVCLYLALWAIVGDWLRAVGALVALVFFFGFWDAYQTYLERASLIENAPLDGQEKGE